MILTKNLLFFDNVSTAKYIISFINHAPVYGSIFDNGNVTYKQSQDMLALNTHLYTVVSLHVSTSLSLAFA